MGLEWNSVVRQNQTSEFVTAELDERKLYFISFQIYLFADDTELKKLNKH